jgi:hypothetical protein
MSSARRIRRTQLGVLMREDPVELLAGDPRSRARRLARRCGLDATAIWEWGVAERVSTGESQGVTGRADVTRSAKVAGTSARATIRRTAGWKPATVSAA